MNSASPPRARQMPTVAVSWGELFDKITILEIKERRISSPFAVTNVRQELAALRAAVGDVEPAAEIAALKAKLTEINETLWEIEDRIRAKEAAGSFDQDFIELARSVYFNNDKRAELKRAINTLLKSGFVEEKQYTPYAG